jgi:anthranilate phosphoribosyltransferase
MVLANAAAALMAAQRFVDPRAGVDAAAQAIDSGKVAALVQRLAELTKSLGTTEETGKS